MRTLAATLVAGALALPSSPAIAAQKKAQDIGIGHKTASGAGPDVSLAGDVTRKKAKKEEARPTVAYDAFRYQVELQVASQRRAQMETLRRIIELGSTDKEMPDLIFRYAELAWEESRYLFFEENRADDAIIQAKNAADAAGVARAEARKARLTAESERWQKEAVARYEEIVRKYPRFGRMDEVLYFLGHNLWDQNREDEALGVYKLLVVRYPKSKYVADSYLAFGEYYFDNSKGQRSALMKALAAYKRAASYPENKVFLYALYKEGWCYYNLGQFKPAADQFKTVILYADVSTAVTRGNKLKLAKDARKDYVLTYSRFGNPLAAGEDFRKVGGAENGWTMLVQLADLYFQDGKDKEAVLTYRQLLRERPLSPEAPLFQARIVDAAMRVGDKKITTEQAAILVQVLQRVEHAGTAKTEEGKKALARGRDLAERTLSHLAVVWHNEGKKTRDEETIGYADAIYRDYFALFPDSRKTYILRFFHGELLYDQRQSYADAAHEYDWVVARDEARQKRGEKPGKWFEKAAEDAVFAWEEVARRAGSPPAAAPGAGPLVIPPAQQGLLDACRRYVADFPQGDKVVEVNYKAARIYYSYNHLQQAVTRFEDIAVNHPRSDIAGYSANLVLDSYNLLENFAAVHAWARRFMGIPALAVGKFKDDLARIYEESGFKLVEGEEKGGRFEEAARKYLAYATEYPDGPRADQSLWNAAVDFRRAGDFETSMKVRQQLIAQHPGSSLMPQALFANAQAYESIAEFSDAASDYEQYAAGYARLSGKAAARRRRPSGPPASGAYDGGKAQQALVNAAVYRMGLRQYAAALKDRLQYLELWPAAKHASASDPSEQVFASIADVYEAQGKLAAALQQLEQHAEHVARDASAWLEVEGRIAKLLVRTHADKAALKVQQGVLKFFRHEEKAKLSPVALDAVGWASYGVNQQLFDAFSALGLHLPPKRLVKDILAKAKAAKEVERAYALTVSVGSGGPAICALWRIARAYQKLTKALYDAPVPPEFRKSEQLTDAWKEQLGEQALPAEQKAKELETSAVEKSRDLGLYNDCAQEALAALAKADPVNFGVPPEIAAAVRIQEARPLGLITTIGGPASSSTPPIATAADRAAEPPSRAGGGG